MVLFAYGLGFFTLGASTVMLPGLFRWKTAGLYILSGLVIPIDAGFIIVRLKLERFMEDFVWRIHSQGMGVGEELTWQVRFERA